MTRSGDALLTPDGFAIVDHLVESSSNEALVWELDTTGPNTFTVSSNTFDLLVHNASECPKPYDALDQSTRDLIDAAGPVPGIRKDLGIDAEFNRWWDELTSEQLDALLKSESHYNQIADRIRRPGGLHEWCMV